MRDIETSGSQWTSVIPKANDAYARLKMEEASLDKQEITLMSRDSGRVAYRR